MKFKFISLSVMSLLLIKILHAQNTARAAGEIITEKAWYMQPWAWLVGGIAVLLILISIFSGGNRNKNNTRTDRVIITKTVKTETEID